MRMRNIQYPNLAAEMARKGLNSSDIAEILGVTTKTARDKLNAVYPWVIYEMKKLRNECFPESTLEYLFHEEGDINRAG